VDDDCRRGYREERSEPNLDIPLLSGRCSSWSLCRCLGLSLLSLLLVYSPQELRWSVHDKHRRGTREENTDRQRRKCQRSTE
jgi:hypothetical protein